MAETLSKDSKVVVFDSAISLDDANVNNVKQGVKLEDLSFVTVVSALPTESTVKKGQIFVNTGDSNKISIAIADGNYVTLGTPLS